MIKNRGPRSCSIIVLVLCLLLGTGSALALTAAEVRELTLNRGLTSNEPYALYLSQQARKATTAEQREELALDAIASAPDTPAFYFMAARTLFPNILKSIPLSLKGLQAYTRSFWWQMSLMGLMVISLSLSLIAALTLAALIRLVRDIPLLAHDINERKSRILLPLVMLPLALSGPVGMLSGILFLSALYMKRSSKFGVFAALLFLISAPALNTVINGTYSFPSAEVRAVVAVNEGRDNMLALDVLKDNEAFEAQYSYGLALKREGHPLEAAEVFKQLIADHPKMARLYTNLGNAFVAAGQFELGKEAYNTSVGIRKTAAALYNLSQMYNNDLLFADGEKLYLEAQQLNASSVSRYSAIANKHPNRFVVDDPLTESEISHFAWQQHRSGPALFTLPSPMTAGVGIGYLILFMIVDKSLSKKAYRCKNCNKVACAQCSGMNKMCAECQDKMSVQDDNSPRARVARMLSANQQKTKLMNAMRAMSFAPPGFAQIYSGRMLSGIIYCWLFVFGILIIILNPLFETGLSGSVHRWIMPVMIPFLIILYYLSFAGINKRLDKGWL